MAGEVYNVNELQIWLYLHRFQSTPQNCKWSVPCVSPKPELGDIISSQKIARCPVPVLMIVSSLNPNAIFLAPGKQRILRSPAKKLSFFFGGHFGRDMTWLRIPTPWKKKIWTWKLGSRKPQKATGEPFRLWGLSFCGPKHLPRVWSPQNARDWKRWKAPLPDLSPSFLGFAVSSFGTTGSWPTWEHVGTHLLDLPAKALLAAQQLLGSQTICWIFGTTES